MEKFHPRVISKLRLLDTTRDRGSDAAAERFERAYGPKRPGESYAGWVDRIESSATMRKVPHGGNHVYMWAFGDEKQRKAILSNVKPEQEPYPKTPRQLYLNLQNRYARAITQGNLVLQRTLALDLSNTWNQLSSKDREGQPLPPDAGVTCSIRGSPNRRRDEGRLLTLEEVDRFVVCSR